MSNRRVNKKRVFIKNTTYKYLYTKIKKIKTTNVLTGVFCYSERPWYNEHCRNCTSYNY